jgi:hypothetical protein
MIERRLSSEKFMRAVVAHESLEQTEPIRQILLGMGVECGAADCVAFSDLPVRLAQGPTDVILVAIGTQWDGVRDTIRNALEQTSSPVLAVGPTNDAPQILKTLQSGAREYLGANRLQADLEAAFEKLRATGTVKESHQGLVVGVVSATPGCGVTTIATNLAFTWAAKYPGAVALVELGAEAADLALSLDLDPRIPWPTSWRIGSAWMRPSSSAALSRTQAACRCLPKNRNRSRPIRWTRKPSRKRSFC